jgi:hypothetical protein
LRHWDGVRIDLPWSTLVVGLAATAYMCSMMAGIAAAPLTYAIAAWLVCETLGWFTGALCARLSDSPLRPAMPAPPEPSQTTALPASVAPTFRAVTAGAAAPRSRPGGPQPLAVVATAADRSYSVCSASEWRTSS